MICNNWKKNKLFDPITNRKITEKSSVYKTLEKECKKKKNTICDKWKKSLVEDEPKNPLSNRKISSSSSIYKTLQKECTKSPKKISPIKKTSKKKSPKDKTCDVIIKTGKRKGEICGSKVKKEGKCGIHSKKTSERIPVRISPKKTSERIPVRISPKKTSERIPVRIPNRSEKIFKILDDIKTFEGPVSVNILTPTKKLNDILGRNAPIVLLLGDLHVGRQGCKKECNEEDKCLSLYQKGNHIPFLKYIEKEANKNDFIVDVFLEYWFSKQTRKTDNCDLELNIPINRIDNKTKYEENDVSALYDNIHNTKCCIDIERKKQSDCVYSENLRFHMADIRKIWLTARIGDAKRYGDTILYLFTRLFEKVNQETFIGAINYQNRIKNAENLFHRLFPGLGFNTILSTLKKLMCTNFNIKEYFKDPLVMEHSIIYYEFNKLDNKLKQILIDEYTRQSEEEEPMISECVSKLDENNLFDVIDEYVNKNYIDAKNNLYSFITKNFSAKLVDMYTIARMLKTPLGGKTSDLSIIYLGNLHITNISNVLVKTGLYEIKKHYDFDNNTDYDYLTKCLNI